MRQAYCTITTASHLPQVKALHHSLAPWMEGIDFVALVVDGEGDDEVLDIHWRTPDHVLTLPEGQAIWDKYSGQKDQDPLRWSLKPVLMLHLLEEGYDRVIFLDNDLFFFADPRFLFREMDTAHLLLTPHWRTLDPDDDVYEFRNHFTDGLYNAGFVGATREAKPALQWWANACLHNCTNDPAKGYFVDQRYLDLLPVYFPPARIVQHRGCNVAYWNRRALPRILQPDGEVLIQGKWPIIFIHFTASLLTEIVETGNEMALHGHLDRYLTTLNEFRPGMDLPQALSSRHKSWSRILNIFRRP